MKLKCNAFAACLAVFVACALPNTVYAGLVVNAIAATSTKGPLVDRLAATAAISNPDSTTGNLAITVSDTSYMPTVSDLLTAASGTFVNATGSTVTFSWYIDRNNVVNQMSELIDTFTFIVPDASESFSHSFTRDLLTDLSAPFSMTLRLSLDLTSGGALNDASWSQEGAIVQAAPEPASVALLALGLAGLGSIRRRHAAG